jgi:purine-binding chemotaxis protein CheW
MSNEAKTHEAAVARAKAGKFLSFAIGHEVYGLEILDVREIIGMMEITAVPKMPKYVKGIVNLRGKVIPVIDLRLKFGLEELKYSEETCIIVLNVRGTLMGIIVDRVCEVLNISQENIEPSPDFGSCVDVDFILGIGKSGGKVSMLLDIQSILTEDIVIAKQPLK